MTFRAVRAFTMAMFTGVVAVRWVSGIAAETGAQLGMEPVRVALMTVTALLAMGTIAFWLLPGSPHRSPSLTP